MISLWSALRPVAPVGIAAIGLVLTSCLHRATLASAREAYASGSYQDAEAELKRLSAEGSPAEAAEAKRLLDAVVDEKRAAASVLIDKARTLRESGGAGRLRAREYLVLARSLVAEGPAARNAAAAVANIDHWQAEHERKYAQLRASFVASTRECRPDEQASALGRLSAMRLELDRTDSLSRLALDAAAACFAASRDLDVIRLTELAIDLRLPDDSLPPAATLRLAVAYAHLPASALRTTSSASLSSGRRAGFSIQLARAAASSRGNAAGGNDGVSRSKGSRATAGDRPADKLSRAQALYKEGRIFEALVLLDRSLAAADKDSGAALRAQTDVWRRARLTLVSDYIDRAETALAGEDPETAYVWYSRVLALEPRHDIALDRVQKLDALRRLRTGS